MPPEIVAGAIPATDVVLNCQLPAMSSTCDGGSEGSSGLEAGAGPEVLSPPPHPPRRMRTESSHEVLDKCFMDLTHVWIVRLVRGCAPSPDRMARMASRCGTDFTRHRVRDVTLSIEWLQV
jgi:hypothetical protein